jgi:hypothetical protein
MASRYCAVGDRVVADTGNDHAVATPLAKAALKRSVLARG